MSNGAQAMRAGLQAEYLPRGPGTYALLLRLDGSCDIQVGALGGFRFEAGLYAYAGSALGGLRGRLLRYLRPGRRRHWHVDYLLERAEPVDVWTCEGAVRLECSMAAAVALLPGAERAVPGFGASDCRCPGHLVYLPISRFADLPSRIVL